MKNILTTILVLFALVVNAQDRDTFTICNNVKVYTYCDTIIKYVRIESDSALFKQGSLSEINGVWLSINKSDSINRLFLDEDINYLDFTEELLDTLSMRWCNQLFERTPTGLKQDTIYDFRTSIDSSYILFATKHYDTLEIEGLALYLSNEDFEKGKVFELLPTVKTIVQERPNYWNRYLQVNSYKISFDKTVKVIQLSEIEGAIWWNGVKPREWQEVDLINYKEFIFIEKPK